MVCDIWKPTRISSQIDDIKQFKETPLGLSFTNETSPYLMEFRKPGVLLIDY